MIGVGLDIGAESGSSCPLLPWKTTPGGPVLPGLFVRGLAKFVQLFGIGLRPPGGNPPGARTPGRSTLPGLRFTSTIVRVPSPPGGCTPGAAASRAALVTSTIVRIVFAVPVVSGFVPNDTFLFFCAFCC